MEEKNITYDSFELLYLYVENIRCFESQGFSFTTEYKIEYNKDTRTLTIEEIYGNEHFKRFFGPNISNINLIVGKNGSGKTTVLDLIGRDDLHRSDLFEENRKNSFYFSVFKTNHNHIYIEGYDTKYSNNINHRLIRINDKNINNSIKYDSEKYFSFIYEVDSEKITYNNIPPTEIGRDSCNQNINILIDEHEKDNSIIIYNKKKSKRIPMTTGIPMLKRVNVDSFKKKYYSRLYKFLHSDFKFVKLLTTSLDISFDINISNLEEIYIITTIKKYINQNFYKQNENTIYFILCLTASFIIKLLSYYNESKHFFGYLYDSLEILETVYKNIPDCFNYDSESSFTNSTIVDFITTLYELQDLFDNLKKIENLNSLNLINHINTLNQIIDELNEHIENIKDSIDIYAYDRNRAHALLTNLLDATNNLSHLNQELTNFTPIIKCIEKEKELLSNVSTYELFSNILLKVIADALLNYSLNSEYDNSLDYFKKLIEKAYHIPINTLNDTSLFIDKYSPFDENVYNFIECVDNLNSSYKKDFFEFEFANNISSGELGLLTETSNLFKILSDSKNPTSIVLLDEPDLAMHPEWSSKFINCLITMTQDISYNRKFQFIITTHSPFMLSDIPKEFITTIDIKTDEKNGNHVRIVDKAKNSFASNYYNLINDAFFLDSTLGHYAEGKIREICDIINNTITNKPLKQADNQTLFNILSTYDYDFLDIIKMTKNNYDSNTIIHKYQNSFSKKKIQDIITNIDKNKSDKKILNTLKVNNIYLSIDYEYIYKKLYKIIDIIDESFIKETLKKELNNNYKAINETNYIDSEIQMLEQKLHNLKKLKEENINRGDKNDKT